MADDVVGKGGTRGSRKPVVRGLLEAVHLAEQCGGAYQRIQGLRAPTVSVYEAARQAAFPSIACCAASIT